MARGDNYNFVAWGSDKELSGSGLELASDGNAYYAFALTAEQAISKVENDLLLLGVTESEVIYLGAVVIEGIELG